MKTSKVLIIIFSIISITGCSYVNMIRMRNANDDVTPVWQNKTTQANIATSYVGVKPYVEVSINGVDGFVFLIDTGASFTILEDTDRVKQLNLEKGYELPIHGWGDGESSTAYQLKADKVSFGGVNFNDVNLAYIPMSKTQYYLHPDELIIDGVLGHDLLHHFSWTFDKKLNQISITKGPYQTTGEEITVPIDVTLSKLYIESELDFGNGQKFDQELIIDTGSRHYLKVNAAFVHNELAGLSQPQVTAADFGLSGRAVHKRITLPNLKLSSLVLDDVKTNIIGSIDDDEDEFWVVGSALLNQFKTVIDYHTSKLHILPYKDSEFKSNYNLLGLELRKLKSGNFIVRYVFPQMASHSVDIKEGDIISQIDGKPAKEINLENWLSISNNAGSHEICRIRNVEKCFSLESRHIQGYSDIHLSNAEK